MTVRTEFTDEQKQVAARMARKGLRDDHISTAIGCGTTTLQNHDEMMCIIRENRSFAIEEITGLAHEKARDGDSAMIMFLMKVQGRMREHSYVRIKDFKGTCSEKLKAVNEQFASGLLSIEEYKMLSAALGEQFKIEELEARLQALESKANN